MKEEYFTFTVDSALLNELGEKLVETVHLALLELVKNAYDADAKEVTIRFKPTPSCGPEIHVIDTGLGMTFEQVKSYWMRIATTNKVANDRSPMYGRPRAGSKGIGRFACRRLGSKLELVTVAVHNTDHGKRNPKFEKTEVTFDWKKFTPGAEVTTIKCPGQMEIIDEEKTGTTLIISGAEQDEWSRRGYAYLKRQLALLVANRGARRRGYEEDPGFNIILEAPGLEGDIKDLREQLISAGWGTLTARIESDHHAVCELEALGIGKKTITSKQAFPHLTGVSLNIGVMPISKGQIRKTDVLSLGTMKEILPNWGGVQVRYRGFRVYPYGEGDDDWLNIDRDRGRRKGTVDDELSTFAAKLRGVDPQRALLSMLSMKNYIGNVEIGTDAQGFDLKPNREGFIQSDAVRELKDFVRFAIDWSTIYRDYYIRKKARGDSEAAQEYLEEIIGKEIEQDKVVEAATSYLEKQFKDVANLLPAAQRRELQKKVDRATDAILKHDESNREELQHLRLIASTSTLLLVFSHEVKSLLGTLEDENVSLMHLAKKLSTNDAKIVEEIRVELRETKERLSDLLKMTSLIGTDSRNLKPGQLALAEKLAKAVKCYQLIIKSYDISLDFDEVPNNVVTKSILEAELYAIILNLLSNSIKSVIAAGGEKRIKVTAKREGGKTIVKFLDSGLGLDESHFEDVFAPFVVDPTGKLYGNLEKHLNPEDKYIVGTGSGLGLSIVKEIVLARDGAIGFRKPPKGWKAELEVVLP